MSAAANFFFAPIIVAWSTLGRNPLSPHPTPAEATSAAAVMPIMCQALRHILALYPETQLREWEERLRIELDIVRQAVRERDVVCAFVLGAGPQYVSAVLRGQRVLEDCESEEMLLVVREVAKLW